jgi:hypothetical protein
MTAALSSASGGVAAAAVGVPATTSRIRPRTRRAGGAAFAEGMTVSKSWTTMRAYCSPRTLKHVYRAIREMSILRRSSTVKGDGAW